MTEVLIACQFGTKPIHDELDKLTEVRKNQIFRLKPHEYLCEYQKPDGRCFTHQSYNVSNITFSYYKDDSHLSPSALCVRDVICARFIYDSLLRFTSTFLTH